MIGRSYLRGNLSEQETLLNSEQLLSFVVEVCEEFKGQDLSVLRIGEVCDFADYFVIVSGTSTKHVQSLGEELGLRCKRAGEQAFSIEGLKSGEWCLLDFGAIVVHIFLPEKRELYNLESLWTGAERASFEREAND